MPNSAPPIPTRINVTFYGALLLSMLLGFTAVAAREATTGGITPPTGEVTPTAGITPPLPSPTGTGVVTPSPPPTPSPTPTPTPSPTPTPTPLPTPTPTPLPTPDALAGGRVVRAPILMYHHVGPIPAGADQIRVNLTVTPENFAAQMKFLAENGYSTISLYDLQYALALGWPLPDKPVILTFDDGYDDIYNYALPHMQARGFTGAVFVITQFVDENRPGYLTWAQIENLRRAGWSIEPHSKTHDDLKGRRRDFLIYQILGSRQTIEAHIGRQPRFFNYPSGAYDDNVIGVLKEAGFWGAVTTEAGVLHRLDGMYTLRRVRVSFETTLDDLRLYLEKWDF